MKQAKLHALSTMKYDKNHKHNQGQTLGTKIKKHIKDEQRFDNTKLSWLALTCAILLACNST
jgi:hypothetical protein